MLHESDQLPRISVGGYLLGTGQYHRVSFRKKEYSFLSSPYTSCTKKIDPGLQAFYDTMPLVDYSYSTQYCYEVCLQTYTYETCNCMNPVYWNIRSIVLKNGTKITNGVLCDSEDLCMINSIGTYPTVLNQDYCQHCQAECGYNEYSIRTSSLPLLIDSIGNDLQPVIENLGVPLSSNWSETWKDDILESYLSIEVICESTRIEKFVQEATLDEIGLLSNIGGHTGLWIGISFLSLLELAEMFFRLIRRFFCVTIIDRFRTRTNNRQEADRF